MKTSLGSARSSCYRPRPQFILILLTLSTLMTVLLHGSLNDYICYHSDCSSSSSRSVPQQPPSYNDDDYIEENTPSSSKRLDLHGYEEEPLLVIALISNNRYGSLVRLCTSLAEADYSHAKEYFRGGINLVFNLEAKSSKRLVDFVVGFRWPHGSKTVRMRLIKGGLVRAVSEAWYPSSMFEYGLLLEDDLEVSPLYMNWINRVMNAHTHSTANRLIGISLYSPRVTETTNPPHPFDSNNVTYQITGNPESPTSCKRLVVGALYTFLLHGDSFSITCECA